MRKSGLGAWDGIYKLALVKAVFNYYIGIQIVENKGYDKCHSLCTEILIPHPYLKSDDGGVTSF